jgi:hypothetical protein
VPLGVRRSQGLVSLTAGSFFVGGEARHQEVGLASPFRDKVHVETRCSAQRCSFPILAPFRVQPLGGPRASIEPEETTREGWCGGSSGKEDWRGRLARENVVGFVSAADRIVDSLPDVVDHEESRELRCEIRSVPGLRSAAWIGQGEGSPAALPRLRSVGFRQFIDETDAVESRVQVFGHDSTCDRHRPPPPPWDPGLRCPQRPRGLRRLQHERGRATLVDPGSLVAVGVVPRWRCSGWLGPTSGNRGVPGGTIVRSNWFEGGPAACEGGDPALVHESRFGHAEAEVVGGR